MIALVAVLWCGWPCDVPRAPITWPRIVTVCLGPAPQKKGFWS